jgi:hypothetical protein
MIGDQQDVLSRLRATLPTRWFPDDAPILTGLLSGLASAWSWVYDLLHYVKAQTRIETATDVWLDIIAQDYFGSRVTRRTGQGDGEFRNRVRRELFRERGTREAIISVLQDHRPYSSRVRTWPNHGHGWLSRFARCRRRSGIWRRRRMGQSGFAISMFYLRVSSDRERDRHGLRLVQTVRCLR